MQQGELSVLLAHCAEQIMDDEDDLVAVELATVSTHSQLIGADNLQHSRIGGVPGRRWGIPRNCPEWFFQYALTPDCIYSPNWRSLFRVPHSVFENLVAVLGHLKRQDTQLRLSIRTEVRIAAFLMWAGGATYSKTGSQLGIGTSTMREIVRQVSRCICQLYSDAVSLPKTAAEIAHVMYAFKLISGLPFCVGAIDGCHIEWIACPNSQKYEYRCFKGFCSIILFAVCDASCRFLYADVGMPGVLSDGTLFKRSNLNVMIQNEEWLGSSVPSLRIGNVFIRPYLIGDCAFALGRNMMKSSSKTQEANNPELRHWNKVASNTRKPIECSFGILRKGLWF